MTKIKEIQDLMENYSVNSNKVQKWIVLNDGATGTNVNSLESILKAKDYKKAKEIGIDFKVTKETERFDKILDTYDNNSIEMINNFFKLKSEKN